MDKKEIEKNKSDFEELMWAGYYESIGSAVEDTSLYIKRTIEELDELGFFIAPASLHHHGNETGYLFKHSYQVTRNLLDLTEKLGLHWNREASPYIIGMFHDLCKCDNYILQTKIPENYMYMDGDPKIFGKPPVHEEWEYNNASIHTGHGDKSVIMAMKLMGDIGAGTLTNEEIACIRWHMGAFDDKENWNHYGHAVTLYPNVLWTHTADMMAARIQEV